jgi:hypothetical protein
MAGRKKNAEAQALAHGDVRPNETKHPRAGGFFRWA